MVLEEVLEPRVVEAGIELAMRIDDRKLPVHSFRTDGFVGMDRRDAPDQVLELAHVSGPAVDLKTLDRRWGELLAREAVPFGGSEEMSREVGDVVRPLAQGRQPDR